VIITKLLPGAIQDPIEYVDERVKPEHASEKFLENDDLMVAPREVRNFVTEHGIQLAAAEPVRPADRYEHILADYSSR
jgi:hypothetical protein